MLRAGFGIFYDRLADTSTLSGGPIQRRDAAVVFDFESGLLSHHSVARHAERQHGRRSSCSWWTRTIVAPRTYQASVGVDRQINKYARVSVTYLNSRGAHLLRPRNINTPINGAYPDGDNELRILTESTGFSRSNQLIVSPNVNYKKMFVFGFYTLSYGKDDNEGEPANPYNFARSGDHRLSAMCGSGF